MKNMTFQLKIILTFLPSPFISTLHSDSALIAPVRCCLVETLSKARSHLPMEITLNTKGQRDDIYNHGAVNS